MRKHYDFARAKKNPYAKRLKTPVTIRLDESTVAYFNDSWMLRLVLDWCAKHPSDIEPFIFRDTSSWYSEALLPSCCLTNGAGHPAGGSVSRLPPMPG